MAESSQISTFSWRLRYRSAAVLGLVRKAGSMKNAAPDGGSAAEIKRKKSASEAECSSSGEKSDVGEDFAAGCDGGREYQKLRIEDGEEKSEDEETLATSDQWQESFNSLAFFSDDSSICSSTEEFSIFEGDAVNSLIIGAVESSLEEESGCSSVKLGEILGERTRQRSLSLNHMPHWGLVSICGKRPEMEDATTVMPQFLVLPPWMRSSAASVDGDLHKDLAHSSGHFFAVYDGHGGAQVANYCRERMHIALEEEMMNLNEDPSGSNLGADECKKKWESVFSSCFLKVDAEVGGKRCRVNNSDCCSSEPVGPETVGSTAVVALVFSSHIIVANCGDSRAVICRGKEPVPLSVDHKPNREDEYRRIENAGGKVIRWNGYRVFGVLAMSRSIGDRYLKPWVIADPEVNCLRRSREDEVLVLATDGLWDVLSNEEVCNAARKRILLWYRKNGDGAASVEREIGVDPAAQAAADYLMKLALQKGSKDNITIIVVDLRPRRRVRVKPPAEY
ncbi:protein phosphatase 2C 50-like [Wolffia australiana]